MSNLLVILLVAIMLAGLGVGGFFGAGWLAERMAGDFGPRPSGNDVPAVEGMEWTVDVLPKATANPAVQLRADTKAREALTPTEIYEKVLPSVVCVQAVGGKGVSIGSGIVVSKSGYIITNYHVIEYGVELTVMLLSENQMFDAALVGYDKELDLAVLKVDGAGLTPAIIGNSDDLEVGDPVYAIGNPMGYLFGTMTDGIVSALSKERVHQLDYSGRLIQTTAALNSGNSGGALVDACGRVVGITSAKVTGVREDVVIEGLGLAIPISDAAPYLNRILRTGHTARPSIGVSCYSAVQNGRRGILVAETTPGTPADGLLMLDDFIIAADGVPAGYVDDMTRIFAGMEAGDEVELTVIRHGKEVTVTIELYDRLKETTD